MVTKKTAIILIVAAIIMFSISIYISSSNVDSESEEQVPVAGSEDLNPDVDGGKVSIVVQEQENPPI